MEKHFIGSVIFTQQIHSKGLDVVKSAAQKAGIAEDKIRDLNSKFVFVRAMNQLKKVAEVQGDDGALKDKLVDDADVCRFQFSRRFIESVGAHYDQAAIVEFDKHSGAIQCSDVDVEKLAQKFFTDHATLWLPRDIGELVRRLLEDKVKRIYLRHGVYFVPYQAAEAVTQVETFLTALGITTWVLPVGAGGRDVKKIHAAIVDDMIKEVLTLQDELDKLLRDDALTDRKTRSRRAELKAQVQRYRELASAVQIDMAELARRAGTAGDVLVMADMPKEALLALAQSGKKPVPGMLLDLQEITVGEVPAMTLAKARSVRVEAPPDLIPVESDEDGTATSRRRYQQQKETLFSA